MKETSKVAGVRVALVKSYNLQCIHRNDVCVCVCVSFGSTVYIKVLNIYNTSTHGQYISLESRIRSR